MKRTFLLAVLASALTWCGSCTKTINNTTVNPNTKDSTKTPTDPVDSPYVPTDHVQTLTAQFTATWYRYSKSILYATFYDPDLTQEIVDTKEVEFFKQYDDGTWTNLPDINGSLSTVVNFKKDTFVIYFQTTDTGTLQDPGVTTFMIKIKKHSFYKPAHKDAGPLAPQKVTYRNYDMMMEALKPSGGTTVLQLQ